MSAKAGELRQILASIIVNFLAFSLGTLVGWTSNGMKALKHQQSPLPNGPLTPSDVDLIDSMYGIGGLMGTLPYGYICDKVGRKWALRSIAIFQIFSFLLIGLSNGRALEVSVAIFFAGFSGGALMIAIPLFVSEIAEDLIRGILGAFFLFAIGFGLIFSFSLATVLEYHKTVWVYVIIPLSFLLSSGIFPETPFFLLKANKVEKAKDSIMYYRGVLTLEENIKVEFGSLKKYVERNTQKKRSSISKYFLKDARKVIFIGIVLVAMEQFTGCFVLLFYINEAFETAEATSISTNSAVILIGMVQLTGSYMSILLVERVGRKKLLTLSFFGLALGMFQFGLATQLIEYGSEDIFLRTVPVCALAVAIFSANAGVFSLTFVILTEISPGNVKSGIFTFIMAMSWIFVIIIFNIRSVLIDWFGRGGLMYFFAVNSILGGLFALFYLPETKGKSFEEISEVMRS